jgi:molybdopterin/thiamine biosynthesis adenylyltransferase
VVHAAEALADLRVAGTGELAGEVERDRPGAAHPPEAIVKLNELVQVSDTEVSTISDLAAQGRIVWERVDNWSSRRSATGVRFRVTKHTRLEAQ